MFLHFILYLLLIHRVKLYFFRNLFHIIIKQKYIEYFPRENCTLDIKKIILLINFEIIASSLAQNNQILGLFLK